MTIRIVRTDITNNDTHVSETQMDSITPDNTITVDKGDHDTLYRELDSILMI